MYNAKTLVRDTLVNNATIKGYFSAAATGSCHVTMANIQMSATYPQVLIDFVGGRTTPGMGADEGIMYLTVEAQGSAAASLHAHKEIGKFRSTIINLIDDQSLSGTATLYKLRKMNEFEGYDEDSQVYWLKLGFSVWVKQSASIP